jgi:hypothetical protein
VNPDDTRKRNVRNFTDRKVAHSYATRRLMPFPHPILGHSNAVHNLTLFAYDAHKKYDPPIYIPTAARRGTGTWQAVTGIFDQHARTLRALAHTPAFCRSRIWLRSWSFSHVPALPLLVVSLILNAAQERCLYIETQCRFHTDWGI